MPLFTSEYVFSDDYPTIEPSLKLDFANARALDPRITFTRASTATYVGANGLIKTAGEDEARFDHDPATGESLGLLIEESRTNYFDYSESASWEDYNGGQTNLEDSTLGIISPTGSTPLVIRPTNTSSTSLLNDRYEDYPSSGGTMIFSVFVKTPPGSQYEEVQLYAQAVNGGNFTASLIFNISTLTTRNAVGAAANAGIFDYGNGWYRVCMSFTCPASTSGPIQRVSIVDDVVAQGTTQSDGLLIFGYQLELGFFPTSYIPTSGSTATRAVEYGYTTNMDFYNQNEGSVVSEIKLLDYGSGAYGKVIWSLNQAGGFGEGIYYVNWDGSNNIKHSVQNSGAQFSGGSFTSNNFIKSAIGLKENSMINYFNGSLVESEDTSGTIPNNIGRLVIGNSAWGSGSDVTSQLNPGNCHIKSFSYYPKRLTNTQLQTLTQ